MTMNKLTKTLVFFLYTFTAAAGLLLWLTGTAFYSKLLTFVDADSELVAFTFSAIVETSKVLFLHAAITWLLKGKTKLGAIIPAVSFFIISVAAHSINTETVVTTEATRLERPVFVSPELTQVQMQKVEGTNWSAVERSRKMAEIATATAKANETKLEAAREQFQAQLAKYIQDSTELATTATAKAAKTQKNGKLFFYMLLLLELVSAVFVYCISDLESGGPIASVFTDTHTQQTPHEGSQTQGKPLIQPEHVSALTDDEITRLQKAYIQARWKSENLASIEAREKQAQKMLDIESILAEAGASIPAKRTNN